MAQGGSAYTYRVDQYVEVIGTEEEGRGGSFYEAQIMERIDRSHYNVKYVELLDDNERTPLIERVPVRRLRPYPPVEYVGRYELGDKVDCEWRDGFWSGHITGIDVADHKYYVEFPLTRDSLWACCGELRPHFDWNGNRFTSQSKFNYIHGNH